MELNKTEIKNKYKSLIEKLEATNTSVDEIRKLGAAEFEKIDFPTRKTEEWKYTKVDDIIVQDYQIAETSSKFTKEEIDNFTFTSFETDLLVFVDGIYSKEFSRVSQNSDKVKIGNLADNLKTELVEKSLNKLSEVDNAFNAMNTAAVNDGLFVEVADNQIVEKPVQVLFVSGKSDKTLSMPRNLISVGKNSQISLVVNYAGVEDSNYFTNSVTEISIGENSTLDYCKIQNESKAAYHVDKIQVAQEKYSKLNSFSLSFGGSIVRNDLNTEMKDENIESNFYGLYLASDKQHIDNHTLADHAKPNCYSNEVYKGVLSGNSRGVFNGKIMVRPDAQQTNAYQTNKTILLSDSARMDTKPQLEIYADDVKCSHGATVGNVDDMSLFYLQARGISKETAEMMLVKAFVFDVVEQIKIEALQKEINQLIEQNIKF
ncbi:MAG: Fe-S cluster assembly protein SufD [Rhodothermaceae bacterium]